MVSGIKIFIFKSRSLERLDHSIAPGFRFCSATHSLSLGPSRPHIECLRIWKWTDSAWICIGVPSKVVLRPAPGVPSLTLLLPRRQQQPRREDAEARRRRRLRLQQVQGRQQVPHLQAREQGPRGQEAVLPLKPDKPLLYRRPHSPASRRQRFFRRGVTTSAPRPPPTGFLNSRICCRCIQI